jgi:hypothetical protein
MDAGNVSVKLPGTGNIRTAAENEVATDILLAIEERRRYRPHRGGGEKFKVSQVMVDGDYSIHHHPLGFYVLALLIVEGTLCIVLTASKLDKEKVWAGFLCMIGTFIGVVVIVTLFVWLNPKHLLYGKDEHSSPALDPSALQDAIGDTIVASVRPECLKNPPK